MRESIGQSFLVTLVVTLVGVIIVILLCAVAYSKAFKVKSKLIDIMERYKDYTAASGEMESYLLSIGYRKNRNGIPNCPTESPDGNNLGELVNGDFEQFHYCVYKYDSGVGQNRGVYYGVLVYIYFDFPIIGDWIEIPIYGETEVFFDSGYIEG